MHLNDALRKLSTCRPLARCALALAFCAPAPAAPEPERPAHPPAALVLAGDLEALRAGFRDPPREAGPWVYWMFFENVMSREEITRELEEMAAAGIAGAEMRFLSMHGFSGQPGPGFDPESWAKLGQERLEFLSPGFIDLLEHACAEARRLGLELAINLGMGWPPGGKWITEEHRSKHLVASSEVVRGKKALRGNEAPPVPPGAMVLAWRLRDDLPDAKDVDAGSFRDLSGVVGPEGRLEWDVPEGLWLIGTFQCVPGGLCDKGDGPEADPGSREAVLFHLNFVLDRLQPRLGKYFGSTLVDVASDSWEYERRGGARYWSPALLAVFPEVAGYDLRERLYALLGRGPDRERTLADLERVEREAIRRNFFGTATAFLNARKLRHRPQVRGRGLSRDFFEAFAASDIPEIEEEVFLPEAVWTAHVLGKPIVSAEAFTFLSGHARNLEIDGQERPHEGPLADPQKQWETSPALLRWHAGAHFARGINRIQMHSFGYSPLGLPPPGWRIYAEVHLNRNVPWWPHMKSLSVWIARHQWVLGAGGPVADALVYPVRSNPPEGPYNVSRDQPASALNAIDGASPYTLARLQERGGKAPYDFSRLVLIDDVRTLDEVRRILALVEDGAILVCCRALPDDWAALHPAGAAPGEIERLRARFRKAWEQGKVKDFRGRSWKEAMSGAQSVRWVPDSAKLSFLHRRVRGGEVYFLKSWGEAFSGEVSFPHVDLVPEIWDADDGTMLPAGQYRVESGRTAVCLSLQPQESSIVVFAQGKPALHAVSCEGGRVEREPDGKLCAKLEGSGPCRVELSDGKMREMRVDLPESIVLGGPWTLAAAPGQGVGLAAPVKIELDKLVSWRAIPDLRTFAGIASYQVDLDLPQAFFRENLGLVLELGEVYELADVWLNGHRLGTSWFPPHRIDIAGHVRPGKNSLRIDVPNILKNHLEQGDDARPSGLLGPVRVRPVGRIVLEENAP